jgi:hypothetical protein
MTLQPVPSESLIYEENFVFFLISALIRVDGVDRVKEDGQSGMYPHSQQAGPKIPS